MDGRGIESVLIHYGTISSLLAANIDVLAFVAAPSCFQLLLVTYGTFQIGEGIRGSEVHNGRFFTASIAVYKFKSCSSCCCSSCCCCCYCCDTLQKR